ncbi:uncharacterized protein LOC144405523 isoform X1 [Gasterosteus aculeatus]
MFVWRCYFIYTLLVTFSSWKAAWQRVYKVCIRLSTSHAMKKSVLLVLLSLQVFLLITAFPSADADSTRIDPLQPAAQEGNMKMSGNKRNKRSSCRRRAGACSVMGVRPGPPPLPPSPPPPPRS